MNTEMARFCFENSSPGGAMAARLASLHAIFDKIAEAQRLFSMSACAKNLCISCAEGCGHCCRGFMPDLLRVEADAIAIHLITNRPELIPRLETPGQSCPFIEEDKPGMNCGIYPARPLVCRLFGFSATMGKNGEPEFTHCAHMVPLKDVTGRRFAGRAALERLFGALPPVMGDFSTQASSIDPESAGERTSLVEAVSTSLSKIGLNSSLSMESACGIAAE